MPIWEGTFRIHAKPKHVGTSVTWQYNLRASSLDNLMSDCKSIASKWLGEEVELDWMGCHDSEMYAVVTDEEGWELEFQLPCDVRILA